MKCVSLARIAKQLQITSRKEKLSRRAVKKTAATKNSLIAELLQTHTQILPTTVRASAFLVVILKHKN